MNAVEYIRKNQVVIAVVLFTLLVIGIFVYFVYFTYFYVEKVRVEISLAPSDASLSVNGESHSPGVSYLEPGVYKIRATKDGYRTHEETLYLHEQKKYSVPISLIPESTKAVVESVKYKDEFLKNEGLAGQRAQVDGIIFREENPIVNRLPYKTLLYTIGYEVDNSDPSGDSIIVTIDAPEGLRDDVVAQINRWGYDPTTLNIKFRKYENPFEN